ncbi:MAG: uroporphyrinogen-III C-methyltransferase [Candidatus Omnitrophota bacterium]
MVYLIGAGPGDEGLITVRGLSLIRAADCILYDSLINPRLLDSAPAHCRKIYVGKRAGCHSLPQQKINRILVAQLRKYRVVVRLKGGDPFIFGRGAEEALYLAERGIEFEVVPGVSSATAVPAYAGIPLTHRDMASTVGFITGQEAKDKDFSAINWAALARGLDTMVFLMGLANLKTIIARLRSAGCPSGMPAAVITSGATSSQRTVSGTLEDILIRARRNKIVAPAIIVVGKVVGLRDRLSWFERRPLWGKRVVVTRAGHQAGALCLRLRELGAEVVEAPVIRIISLRADRQIKKALSSLNYRWVFFTSQNGSTFPVLILIFIIFN